MAIESKVFYGHADSQSADRAEEFLRIVRDSNEKKYDSSVQHTLSSFTRDLEMDRIFRGMSDSELQEVYTFLQSDFLRESSSGSRDNNQIRRFLRKATLQFTIVKTERINTEIDQKIEELSHKIAQSEDQLKNQKFDLLAMITLIFSGFTFLSVNASLVAGVANIKPEAIWEAVCVFILGNIVVIIGLYIIFWCVSRIMSRDVLIPRRKGR